MVNSVSSPLSLCGGGEKWKKVKVSQSCLTLCNLMGYTVHRIFQARILEWLAYRFSSGSSWPRNRMGVSCIAGGFFTNWAIREAMYSAATAAKSLQSCPTLRSHRRQPTRLPRPWDSPGKNTGGVAISFSNAWKWKVKVKSLSRVRLFATPWTVAYQAPPSMGFSRQEYLSGLPLPSPYVF